MFVQPHVGYNAVMHLVVRKSATGLGAFATVPFKSGDIIIDWSQHPLFAEPPQIPHDWRFVQVAPGVFNGPVGPEEHPDAYINHSCEPNSEIRRARPQVLLVALRDIAYDEEITFDYATLYRKPWSMRCSCGTRSCRKVISGR